MRVRFWGTRGSIAKPGPGTVRYGGNTSCVEVRSRDGTLVVLDCGTGAHGLGQRSRRRGPRPMRGHILIGHTHWDHIQGFPFFAPLFVAGQRMGRLRAARARAVVAQTLAGQMQYTYFPVEPRSVRGDHPLPRPGGGRLQIGDVRVTARYLNHPALTLGYRLEADGVALVYATDHEPHTPRARRGRRRPRSPGRTAATWSSWPAPTC